MHGTLDHDLVKFAVLPGMHCETYPVFAVSFELFELGRVKGRRLRAGVDFGFQPRHADLRQADPFTPAREGA